MACDTWETPRWLFKQLEQEFNFEVDLAATAENTQCEYFVPDFFTGEYESVTGDSFGIDYCDRFDCAFMNPPYSRGLILKFVEKAWEDSKYCKIVMLLPVRTSTKWWSVFWNYGNIIGCPKPGVEVGFLPKRVAFVKDGKEVKGTSFDSCIVILDRRYSE